MTLRKEYPKWTWQSPTGVRWENIEYGGLSDGKNSKCNLITGTKEQGGKAYTPNDVYFEWSFNSIKDSMFADGNVLTGAYFNIAWGDYPTSNISFPYIEVYKGRVEGETDELVATIKEYEIKEKYSDNNKQWLIQYKFSDYVKLEDVAHITVRLVFDGATGVSGKKSIVLQMNNAYLKLYYEKNEAIITIWDWVNHESFTTHDDFFWTISAKNTGNITGSCRYRLELPTGARLVSAIGDGTYFPQTQQYNSVIDSNKDSKITKRYKFMFDQYGTYTVRAVNLDNPNNELVHHLSVNKYYPKTSDNPNPYTKRDDIVETSIPQMIACADGQYIDVYVQGFPQNLDGGATATYHISFVGDYTFDEPYIFMSRNIEEDSIDWTATANDSGDLSFDLEDDSKTFAFTMNIPIQLCSLGDFAIWITDTNGKTWKTNFAVDKMWRNKFITNPKVSHDKMYVRNTVNVGAEADVWTINLQSSKQNFFSDKDSELEIAIEDLQAYIGSVPLDRCHKADVKANTSNSLIKTNYLNRKYLGKKGDYDEQIDMTLRLHWKDIATLQGLVAMDKPIPIDTIPYFEDGDPLNHRGWAEIYGIKNIHKINDMLYECDVEVDYITHDILTNFRVEQRNKITDKEIDYLLEEAHDFGDNIVDRFYFNYSQFFNNAENTTGDLVGEYTIPPLAEFIMTDGEGLCKYSNYNLIWSNALPLLMSEDYDGNWEMAVRIKNKENKQVVFEHLYNNFKHYDSDKKEVINKCDATTKVLDGSNYKILNHTSINLLYDEIDDDEKGKKLTYFNRIGDMDITSLDDKIEIFLLDSNNKVLTNKKVILTLTTTDGVHTDVYNTITDSKGRAKFNVPLVDDEYIATFEFKGDNTYHSCEYQVMMDVEYDAIKHYFTYDKVSTITTLGSTFDVTLYDGYDDACSGYEVAYSFKDSESDRYTFEETIVTDSNGVAKIPLDFTNGSKQVRVMFKGFEYDNTTYEPCFFEEVVNVYIKSRVCSIEADDVHIMDNAPNKTYSIILRDESGNPLPSKTIRFSFNNGESSLVVEETTDSFGVARVPINLGIGLWDVDVMFKGDVTYAPCREVRTLEVSVVKVLDTYMVAKKTVFNDPTEDYKVTLYNEWGQTVANVPVRFVVTKDTTVVDTLIYTDEYGVATLPFTDYSSVVTISASTEDSTLLNGASLVNSVVYNHHRTKNDVDIVYDEDDNIFRLEYNGEPIYGSGTGFDVIITSPNNAITYLERKNNSSYMGYFPKTNVGTYNVTVVFKGNSTFARKTETITYESDSDSRESYVHSGEYAKGMLLDDIHFCNHEMYLNVGDKFTLLWDIDLPVGTLIYFYGQDNPSTYVTFGKVTPLQTETFIDNETREDVTVNYNLKIDGVVTNQSDPYAPNYLYVNMVSSDFFSGYNSSISNEFFMAIGDDPKISSTLTVADFGKNHKTYQNLLVSSTSSSASSTEVVNDRYDIVILNTDTYEILRFNGVLGTKGTKSLTEFELNKGNYLYYAIGNGVNGYACGMSSRNTLTPVVINSDSTIEPDPSTIGNIDFSDIDVMPSLNEYDGSVYGSNIYFELRNNILNFIDYGMSRDKVDASGDIILNNISLPMVDYDFEVEIAYKNSRYDNISDLTGKIQFNIWEDSESDDGATDYNNIVVTPTPIQKGITKYTRYTDEGTMYYVQLGKDDTAYYICNPYIQYKGGTELQASGGWSLFNLDNNISPIIANNGLVKAEFHRRTGYVVISRYDEITQQYVLANVLKIGGSPKLALVENYTDDSIELRFGETLWKMWRGRPFIQVKHPNTDIRIINLVNRVYCETIENELGMGFIEDSDAMYSIFNPQTSIQRFPKEMHIGESIREDNFILKTVTATNNIYDLSNDAELQITDIGSDKAIKVVKNETCRIGLNFPSAPSYVEKPSKDFSLLLGQIKATGSDGTIIIKARGFDENGATHTIDELQLGIWEYTITETISIDESLDTLRVTFNNVPSEVKYVDFTIILPNAIATFECNHIMLYDGDSDIEWQRDTRKHNARTSEIRFNDTYYACLYNEQDECGLGIFRLGQEPITLREIGRAEETVLAPYMKTAYEHDRVENVFKEYINCKDQIIDIDWEN